MHRRSLIEIETLAAENGKFPFGLQVFGGKELKFGTVLPLEITIVDVKLQMIFSFSCTHRDPYISVIEFVWSENKCRCRQALIAFILVPISICLPMICAVKLRYTDH